MIRRKRKLYYVESGLGCGIRSGLSEEEVYKEELESVGTYHDVSLVREASLTDIHNVKSMGGYVPEL